MTNAQEGMKGEVRSDQNKNCPVCQFINSNKKLTLFEDDDLVVVLNPTPSVIGETLVIPKKHYTIMEQVPNKLIGKLFSIANKVSAVLFQALGLEGTNIIVNNGLSAGQELPHFLIHVIPRKQNDGLKFSWTPKKLTEEQMATVELKIKEFTKGLVVQEEKKAKTEVLDKDIEVIRDVEEKHVSGGITSEETNKGEGKQGKEQGERDKGEGKEGGKKGDEEAKEAKNKGSEYKDRGGYKEKEIKGNYLVRHLRRLP